MLEVLVPVKVQGINASGDLVVFFPTGCLICMRAVQDRVAGLSPSFRDP